MDELINQEEVNMNNQDQHNSIYDLFNALDDKLNALYDIVYNQILVPMGKQYEEQKFNDFKDKYGEKFEKFNPIMKKSLGQEDYDLTRAVYDEFNEDPRGYTEEEFVNENVSMAEKYVEEIKESLGIPTETATEVTITTDENGEVTEEVKVDENDDGVPETEVKDEEKTEEELIEEYSKYLDEHQ